mmetsp:Transcript_7891/g.22396  ORF Transcript_7891/g.22396 Transcript_7891/m.22396 type:complete len:418 (+) Transcript_7891:113-1366(+)
MDAVGQPGDNERWRATVSKQNVKLLSRVIACSEKIGEDVAFDSTPHSYTVKTVNKARSVFAQFVFDVAFFDSYACRPGTHSCRVKVKPCMAVFRSLGSVEHISMRMNDIDCRIVFDLECRYGVRKNYKLTLEEADVIQCHFSKETPNRVRCQSRILSDMLAKMHGTDDVSLIFGNQSVVLKTYVEEDQLTAEQRQRVTNTEMLMHVKDFEEFQVVEEGEDLVVPVKELKAICTFAEALGQPVTMCFSRAGRPFIISMKFYHYLTVDFVLATLGGGDDATQATQTQTTQPQATTSQPHMVPQGASDRPMSAPFGGGTISDKVETNTPSLIPTPHTPSMGSKAQGMPSEDVSERSSFVESMSNVTITPAPASPGKRQRMNEPDANDHRRKRPLFVGIDPKRGGAPLSSESESDSSDDEA